MCAWKGSIICQYLNGLFLTDKHEKQLCSSVEKDGGNLYLSSSLIFCSQIIIILSVFITLPPNSRSSTQGGRH